MAKDEMSLPPPLTLADKNRLREEFFTFCQERGLSGWAAFAFLCSPEGAPRVQGHRTTGAMSYFSGMHIAPMPEEACIHCIGAFADMMLRQGPAFKERLASFPPAEEHVIADIPDGSCSP